MTLSWCYVSTATSAFYPRRLDELYRIARDFNAEQGISGVLLYCNQRFCQLIEGPEAGMRELIRRIEHSILHTDILTLHQGPVAAEVFPSWSLGSSGDWRGEPAARHTGAALAERLTPDQQAACQVLARFIEWEDAGAAQDFAPQPAG